MIGIVGIFSIAGVTAYAQVFSTEPVSRPAPVVTIYATPAEIRAGESTTLTWSSRNAAACYGSGAWSGAKSRNGTKIVSPSGTSTFALACHGRGGATTASFTVIIGNATSPGLPTKPEPPVEPQPPTKPPVTSTTTTTLPPPTCTLTSSKSSVLVNEPFTLSWTTTNATYISDPGGKNNPTGTPSSFSVPVAGQYTYAITA